MFRRSIATLLSAALVATSVSTAPARADEDVAKVLGGLVVLGLIAKAIDDRNDRKRDVRHSGTIVHPPVVHRDPGLRRHPIKRHRKIAPQRCLRETWTHRGTRTVYGARCMQRFSQAQLPHRCLRENQTRSGPRYFYTRNCLSQYGWKV